jgi:hypothetical protein
MIFLLLGNICIYIISVFIKKLFLLRWMIYCYVLVMGKVYILYIIENKNDIKNYIFLSYLIYLVLYVIIINAHAKYNMLLYY